MHVDISKLDRHISFLQSEAAYLRKLPNARWADGKAAQFDQIAEVLRQLRQEYQMTGIGGRRLTE